MNEYPNYTPFVFTALVTFVITNAVNYTTGQSTVGTVLLGLSSIFASFALLAVGYIKAKAEMERKMLEISTRAVEMHEKRMHEIEEAELAAVVDIEEGRTG